jgi:membrane protease subunit HflC
MKQFGIGFLVVAIFLLFSSMYTVREDQLALISRLGKLSTDSQGVGPGLHFKAPFIDTVFRFDRKVLSLETATERFLTKEQKDVQVDAVVKWQIYDVQKYFQSTRGDEERARITLTQIIKDRLRDEFNKREVREVVTTARFEMIERLTKSADDAAEQLGINVVDVRIKRIELPDEVSESVFNRMRSERTQVANRLRSQGEQEATTRRANADRESSITVAEAERDAQRLRGEGDAEAARIYAEAYNRDPEFYAFYRSLEAYREAFSNDGNMLVLDPDSEFFKYFEESK